MNKRQNNNNKKHTSKHLRKILVNLNLVSWYAKYLKITTTAVIAPRQAERKMRNPLKSYKFNKDNKIRTNTRMSNNHICSDRKEGLILEKRH